MRKSSISQLDVVAISLLLVLGNGCSTHDKGSVEQPVEENRIAETVTAPVAPPDILQEGVVVLVPSAFGSSQGAGVFLDTGEILTAAHVLVDEVGRVRDLTHLEIRSIITGHDHIPLLNGGGVAGNVGYDTAYITPTGNLGRHKCVTISKKWPQPGDDSLALLLSSKRGSTAILQHGKVLGTSYDGRFLAVSGESTQGDSGGPVVDANGELIGIVVSGGNQISLPFQAWKEPGGYRWQSPPNSQQYSGPFILCARPFR
jgi:hypothetical protein